MRRRMMVVVLLLALSALFGATIFREQIATAASGVLNVFVTNTSDHPVPVVEQGTQTVSVTGTTPVSITGTPTVAVGPPTAATSAVSHHVAANAGSGILQSITPVDATLLVVEAHQYTDFVQIRSSHQNELVLDGPAQTVGGYRTYVIPLSQPLPIDELELICDAAGPCDATVNIVGS
jgi:hypothetical protein